MFRRYDAVPIAGSDRAVQNTRMPPRRTTPMVGAVSAPYGGPHDSWRILPCSRDDAADDSAHGGLGDRGADPHRGTGRGRDRPHPVADSDSHREPDSNSDAHADANADADPEADGRSDPEAVAVAHADADPRTFAGCRCTPGSAPGPAHALDHADQRADGR